MMTDSSTAAYIFTKIMYIYIIPVIRLHAFVFEIAHAACEWTGSRYAAYTYSQIMPVAALAGCLRYTFPIRFHVARAQAPSSIFVSQLPCSPWWPGVQPPQNDRYKRKSQVFMVDVDAY